MDLKNGAKLNIAEGGTLTLTNGFDSIKLNGENTELNAENIIAKNLTSLTLNVEANAKLNTKNFIFQGGTLTSSGFYGENVRLENNANITLQNSGTIAQNLFISGSSTFDTQPNELILSGGENLAVSGNSTFKVKNNQGTLGIADSNGENTKILVEKGSKLEIKKLLAQKGSSVTISLDLDKVENGEVVTPTPQTTATSSTHKNFDIEATNSSNVYVNSWDMNTQSFDTSTNSGKTTLTTDTDSKIHFDTLKHDMTKENKITSPINANLTIRNSLSLEGVGKANNGSGGSGNDNERFHALKLQGNNGGSGNGKNLTLERICVSQQS